MLLNERNSGITKPKNLLFANINKAYLKNYKRKVWRLYTLVASQINEVKRSKI